MLPASGVKIPEIVSSQLTNGSNGGPRSFVHVVRGNASGNSKGSLLAGFSSIPSVFYKDVLNDTDDFAFKTPSRKNDKPAIILSDREVTHLSENLQLTLIGKFPAGRPKWEAVRSIFMELKLQGDFKCLNLDVKHIVLHLSNLEDYIRLFSKQLLFVQGFPLKLFKWTPDFRVNVETSFAPIWISLPLISLHLYNRSMLYSIATIFGTPLKLDYATSHWLRPSCARILVELDLRKSFVQELWIGTEEQGYTQQVIFENVPGYCSYCHKIGHFDASCFYLHPELKSMTITRRNKVNQKVENKLDSSNIRDPLITNTVDNSSISQKINSVNSNVTNGLVDNLASLNVFGRDEFLFPEANYADGNSKSAGIMGHEITIVHSDGQFSGDQFINGVQIAANRFSMFSEKFTSEKNVNEVAVDRLSSVKDLNEVIVDKQSTEAQFIHADNVFKNSETKWDVKSSEDVILKINADGLNTGTHLHNDAQNLDISSICPSNAPDEFRFIHNSVDNLATLNVFDSDVVLHSEAQIVDENMVVLNPVGALVNDINYAVADGRFSDAQISNEIQNLVVQQINVSNVINEAAVDIQITDAKFINEFQYVDAQIMQNDNELNILSTSETIRDVQSSPENAFNVAVIDKQLHAVHSSNVIQNADIQVIQIDKDLCTSGYSEDKKEAQSSEEVTLNDAADGHTAGIIDATADQIVSVLHNIDAVQVVSTSLEYGFFNVGTVDTAKVNIQRVEMVENLDGILNPKQMQFDLELQSVNNVVSN